MAERGNKLGSSKRTHVSTAHNVTTRTRMTDISSQLSGLNLQEERKKNPGNFTYNADRVVGNGTFGVVYQATIAETGETVAIKKVY